VEEVLLNAPCVFLISRHLTQLDPSGSGKMGMKFERHTVSAPESCEALFALHRTISSCKERLSTQPAGSKIHQPVLLAFIGFDDVGMPPLMLVPTGQIRQGFIAKLILQLPKGE
jgi:hypothetical protein